MYICFCTDKYQFKFPFVTILSIIKNTSKDTISMLNFIIFCDTNETKIEVTKLINKHGIILGENIFALIGEIPKHINNLLKKKNLCPMNFFRFYIPEYIEEDFIYIDNDVIFLSDINEILLLTKNNKSLCAVKNSVRSISKIYNDDK